MIAGIFHGPVVLQGESAECGLACMAMVSGALGKPYELAEMRSLYPVSTYGARLDQLMRIASDLCLDARPVKFEIEEIGKLNTPAVLHWDLKHFVVLEKVRGDKVFILDPAVGRRIYKRNELSDRLTGIAIEMAPSARFEPAPGGFALDITDLLSLARSVYPTILQIFLLSILFQFALMAMPFYILFTVDIGLGSQDRDWIMVIALSFLVLQVAKAAIIMLRGQAVVYVTNRIGAQLATLVFDHMIRLPMSFFERRKLADILSRFNAVDNINNLLSKDLIPGLIDGILSLSILIVLLFINPVLTAITSAFLLLDVIYRVSGIASQKEANARLLEQKASHHSGLMQDIATIESIKMHCEEQKARDQWRSRFVRLRNQSILLDKQKIRSDGVRVLVMGAEFAATIYVGSLLVANLELGIAQFMAFVLLKQIFVGSITQLVSRLPEVALINTELSRLKDILLNDVEFDRIEKPSFVRERKANTIELVDVHYSFPGSSVEVLSGVNLRFMPDSLTWIKGESGSGKSTLLRLLAGLISPTKGSIFVDGMALDEYGLREYRSKVCLLGHAVRLLPGSIMENITGFDDYPDSGKVRSAAQLSRIDNFGDALPSGFDSRVGESDHGLSAGQIQRIALARALYKEPSIIILDEALSNLETPLALEIISDLRGLGKMIFVVSHAFDLYRLADNIFTIAGGEIEFDDPEQRVVGG